jgi:iron complex outermembrane recepter protein
MRQKTLIASAVTAALALFAGGVSAQDVNDSGNAEPKSAKHLEAVTVTGTRIRSADVETAQPIYTIDRQEIQRQGYVNVGDILSHISAVGAPSYSKSAVLTSNTYAGGSYVELRGLGFARTLVLVDGRRWGTNTDGFTDLDTIPSSIIERVEVLKDGASAIYGSDAIAGVINIITRSNFDGVEFNAYAGQYAGYNDNTTQQYDITVGHRIGKFSYIANATYAKEDPIWAKDRDFSRYPRGPYFPNSGLSAYGPGGLITNNDGDLFKLNPGGDSRNFADYHPYNASVDNYNADQQMMLMPGSERKSLFGKARYEITDNVGAFMDASLMQRIATIQIAGYPLGTGTTGIPLDADSYYNPLGSQQGYGDPQDVSFLRRMVEIPRLTKNTNNTYRFGTGLEGAFEVGSRNFNWDVSGYVNKNKGEIYGTGNYNLLNLENALGPSFMDSDGLVKCGTPGSVINGCVPVNVLANPGGITPEMLNYIGVLTNATYGTLSTGFAANLAGDIVELPAGTMQFATGVEHRRESGYSHPDPFSATGNSTDLASDPFSGKYAVDEAYAELKVPLLANLPGVNQLSVDLASRFSHYSTFGNTTNSKFGIEWKPIGDLLVRGSIGQGFRSPTISDLYGGQEQTFDVYSDPCDVVTGAVATGNANAIANCRAAGVGANFRQTDASGNAVGGPNQSTTPFISGSNPNLKPETSLSKTMGLVYSPSWTNGLNVSLDWYNIRINNLISAVSPDDVLDDCYLRNIQAACTQFKRDPVTHQVVDLVHTLTNRGKLETEGFDLGISYRLPTAFGRFAFSTDANYVTKYYIDQGGDSPIDYENGVYSNWRMRNTSSLDWSYGNFGATWTVRYYSGLKESCVGYILGTPACNLPDHYSPGLGTDPMRKVGAIAFNDLQARWTAPWKGTISLGVNNIFDRKGPLFYTASSNSIGNSGFVYNPSYDYGRFVYLRYNQKFDL